MRILVCLVAVVAVAAAEDKTAEGDKKDSPKNKRGLFDLGYGLQASQVVGYGLGSDLESHTLGLGDSYDDVASGFGLHKAVLGEPRVKSITITKEVPVGIPKPYAVPVVKHVPVPVKVPVAVPVDRPYPVHVVKPYPVHVDRPVPYAVEKPVPYAVKVPVEVPVKVPVPYAVHQPYPVHVPVEKPVPVPHPVPVYVKDSHDYHSHY